MAADLTLAVLTGGGSRRMGRDKASIEVGGIPLAAHPALALRGVVAEVLLCGRAVPGVQGRPVPDLSGVSGPLAGVLGALLAARTALVAVVACDAPDLEPRLVVALAGMLRASEANVAVGCSARGPEPLPAVVRRAAFDRLAELATSGTGALHRAWEALGAIVADAATCRTLDPEGLSFVSWNRPEDVRPRVPRAPRTLD